MSELPVRARVELEGARLGTTLRGDGTGDVGVGVLAGESLAWLPGDLDALASAREELAVLRATLVAGDAPLGALIAHASIVLAPGETFPHARYAAAIEGVAAAEASSLVVEPWGLRPLRDELRMVTDALPVARVVRDARARVARLPVYPVKPGDGFEQSGTRVVLSPGRDGSLVRTEPPSPPAPWPDVEPLGQSHGMLDARALVPLLDEVIPAAIARAVSARGVRTVVLGLRVVGADGAIEREYAVRPGAIDLQHAAARESDAVVVIAADALRALVAGDASWDEVIARRAVCVLDRLLEVSREGAQRTALDPLFLRYVSAR